MRFVRRLLGWFFLIIGIFEFFRNPIPGLVFISWGVLLLPFTNRFALSKGWHPAWWHRLAIVLVGLVLISLATPSPQNQQTSVSSPHNPTQPARVSRSPSLQLTSPIPAVTKSPDHQRINATIEKRALDVVYPRLSGQLEERGVEIIVNYRHDRPCGSEAPVPIGIQPWRVIFNRSTSTWKEQAKEIPGCHGKTFSEWMDVGSGSFTIQTDNGRTVLRADEGEGDSVLKNRYVISYSRLNGS